MFVRVAAALAAGVLVCATVARGQVSVEALHWFEGAPADGAFSVAALLEGTDGNLYGTTAWGGAGTSCGTVGCGVVFRMAPDGTGYTVLHSFAGGPTDGATPVAAPIQATDGNLYGTTVNGGASNLGIVYQIAPDGTGYTVLHQLAGAPTDGANPVAAPIQATDGNLYGTTAAGGTNSGGTVYRMALDGTGYSIVHSFAGTPTDGNNPQAALIEATDGNLYGTTFSSGNPCGPLGCGIVFRMAPDGTGYTVLHGFAGGPTDGAHPQAALIEATDGNLYGTTVGGGASNLGIVYQIASDGTGYTVLHQFAGTPTDGANPVAAPIQATDGNLYGTTDTGGIPPGGGGTVYAMALDGTGYTVLHSFKGGPADGVNPQAALIQATDGNLYGTTKAGGPFGSGDGEVFRLTSSPTASIRR